MPTCACVYSRLCVRQCQYIFGFPFDITWLSACSASCGGGVKGCLVRWSQQEATSVVWCLTRMDCMTDAHGVHPGFPGHAALALRSAGVRASLELSPPTDSRKPINFKHRLIIWGGNCKSNGPLILVEVHPLSFHAKQDATSFSALLFSLQFVFPPLFGRIYPVIVMRIFPFACGETKTQQCSGDGANMTIWYTDSLHVCDCARMVLLSASWQTHNPAQSQLPREYSGSLCANSLSPNPLHLSAAFSK